MQVRVPDYFDEFSCLAGACPHSCCIGWEVVIDEDTAWRYQAEPGPLGEKLRAISVTGFSTFFVDVAMGILTVLFNRQIMKYLGSDALAIHGPIIQVSTFVQCCAYSVGQAAQP